MIALHHIMSCQKKIVKTLGKRPWEISYEAYNYTPESDSSSIGSIRTLFEKLEDELEDDMDYHIFLSRTVR